MLYYLTAAGLIAHTFFWGLGLAWLGVPREWRRWSWVFAPACGWALQSAVVWAGAHTALAGTDSYALGSELVPAALLIVAVWRGRVRGFRGWAGVLGVAVVAGWLLLSPMTAPGRGLTASSLGSCDHADYAAGARVFQEFSRDDRTGFLGLPEVTRVRSADNFFDFWLRLNHFTPSALLAHNALVFGVEAWRLVSVSAAVLVLLNLPLVFFLSRVMIGVKGASLLALTGIYALSPLNAYAVHQGGLGQIYAAQGIGLLTLTVFGASRAATAGRSVRPFLSLVLVALWLLAGSYNFILLVCLAPSGGWLLAQLAVKRNLRATGRVLGLLAGAVTLCAGLFWGRFSGLAERFSLFEQYDFGWAVPLASPEGWLGVLRDTALQGWPAAVRVVLSAMVAGLYLWGLVRLWRRQRDRALAAVALVLPVIAGWGLLAWESRVRANASYDAYKLLAVFFPGLLAGLLCWLAVAGRRFTGVILAPILAANLWGAVDFRRVMSAPPLRVDRRLAGLAQLETDPRVASLNMLVGDFWSRLWANAFLLRKPQYFPIHTYEGRLNTALRGEWDLRDDLLRTAPLAEADLIRVNERFDAVRVGAPGRMQAGFADGWHAAETSGAERWRWSEGAGRILVTNPADHPVQARLTLNVRGYLPGPLELRLEQHSAGVRALDGSRQSLVFEHLLFQPGNTVITLTGNPGVAPGDGDTRRLSFALHEFELSAVSVN
ncbi:MAG: hypothetical protein HYX71_11805 [Opitutae bacterium]|nr:hypothetical protein [Opitutae bacterium]